MAEHETRRGRAKKYIALSMVVAFATVMTIFLVNMVQTVQEVRGRHAMAVSAETTAGEPGTQAEPAKGATNPDSRAASWGFIAAALVTGVGCIGAGIAVSAVGAAGLGVVGEKPELFTRALIFVGLAEGIAIYGLIIAIMILTRI
jgi:F0F1-type ATP synthase membrane subunit c/vacuolar-type H+-ATPase subunit K